MNRFAFVLPLLVACLVSCHAQQQFPNINLLGFGYDIFKGNPHATSDAGLVGGLRTPVYDMLYSSNQTTADGKWAVPDNVDVVVSSFCSTETLNIRGEKSYENSLAMSASVSTGLPSGSFSASLDYQRISNETYQDHKIQVHSIVECTIYRAALRVFSPPKISPYFNLAISSLLKFPTNSLLARDIVSKFGTHFLADVNMGAKLVKQDVFTQSSYQSLLSQSVDISTASKLSLNAFLGYSPSGTESEILQKYDNSRSEVRFSFIGAKPVIGSGSANDQWLAEIEQDPYPHSVKLTPLDEAISVTNFPSFNQTAIDSARSAIQEVLKSWCTTAGGISCNGAKDDISL